MPSESSVLDFRCPHCAGTFRVSPAMAGQKAACPFCQRRVTITAPSARAEVVEPAEPVQGHAQRVEIRCQSCSGAFAVNRNMAGQQVL